MRRNHISHKTGKGVVSECEMALSYEDWKQESKRLKDLVDEAHDSLVEIKEKTMKRASEEDIDLAIKQFLSIDIDANKDNNGTGVTVTVGYDTQVEISVKEIEYQAQVWRENNEEDVA